MAVSAEIFRFPGRDAPGRSRGWTSQDVADIYRAIDLFARQGLILEAASGLSEEGDPRFALEEVETGEALIHIARINGFYSVQVLDFAGWQAETLRAVLDQLIQAKGLPVLAGGAEAEETSDEPDSDGTSGFLRVVSTVLAVLTADLIAQALDAEAEALPLVDPLDEGFTVSAQAELELPALPTVARRPAADPDRLLADTEIEPVREVDRPVSSDSAADRAAPVHTAAPVPGETMASAASAPASAMAAIMRGLEEPAEPPVMVAGQRLLLSEGGTPLAGTPDSDLFHFILDEQPREELALVDFMPGQDTLVTETSTDMGTGSGLVLDPSYLLAQPWLIVVGQPAMPEAVAGPPIPPEGGA